MHALGWTGLNNSFGGKEDPIDMLPFPDFVRQRIKKKEVLSRETINCIKRLHTTDKLPVSVVTAIAEQSEILKDYLTN